VEWTRSVNGPEMSVGTTQHISHQQKQNVLMVTVIMLCGIAVTVVVTCGIVVIVLCGVVLVVPRGVAVMVVALHGVVVTFIAPCGVGPWCGVAVTVVALHGATVRSQSSRSPLSLHVIAIMPLLLRLVVGLW
jgi:hypothetical protein